MNEMTTRPNNLLFFVPLCFVAVCFSSAIGSTMDPDTAALLKKIKNEVLNFDASKLQPACRKGISKCRSQLLVILQLLKSFQESFEPYLKSKCVVQHLKQGLINYEIECDMKGKYGQNVQCFKDPVLVKALGPKYTVISNAMNCMVKNALNYDNSDPDHRF